MSSKLQQTLRCHDWPGNVRELRNEIERIRLMNSDKPHYNGSSLFPMLKFPIFRWKIGLFYLKSVVMYILEIIYYLACIMSVLSYK